MRIFFDPNIGLRIFSNRPTIRIFSDSDIGLTAQASEIDFWQFAAAKKIYCDIIKKICKIINQI